MPALQVVGERFAFAWQTGEFLQPLLSAWLPVVFFSLRFPMKTPDPLDPAVLQQQQQYLYSIPADHWLELFRLTKAVDFTSVNPPYGGNETISAVHLKLYDLKIIFNFPWIDWEEGRKMYNDPHFDFGSLAPLEASMMLTAICRSDRFSEGELLMTFLKGQVQKLVGCFRVLVQ